MGHPRVLLVWEYGSGRGHIGNLSTIARRLKQFGFHLIGVHPSFAEVSENDAFDEHHLIPNPAQLTTADFSVRAGDSYNNTLYRMGMADPKYVFTRLKLWERVYAEHKPDLVIADFAPFALMAAWGRIPTIAFGNGYTLPPVGIPAYRPYRDLVPSINADALFSKLQTGAKLAGVQTGPCLPDVFRSDRHCCATLDFIDPFNGVRRTPVIGPLYKNAVTAKPDQLGEGVFSYLSDSSNEIRNLMIKALVESGLPVKLFASGLPDSQRKLVEGTSVSLLARPLTGDEIARYARLVVHFGGHGLMNEMLVAGIPQFILPTDVEKMLHGKALERSNLAHFMSMQDGVDTTAVARAIRGAFADQELLHRTREFAVNMLGQSKSAAVEHIASATAELLAV